MPNPTFMRIGRRNPTLPRSLSKTSDVRKILRFGNKRCAYSNSTESLSRRPTQCMAVLRYKGHRIVAGGQLQKPSGLWLPVAEISWEGEDGGGSQLLDASVLLFETREAAEKSAVVMAQSWIDQRRRKAAR